MAPLSKVWSPFRIHPTRPSPGKGRCSSGRWSLSYTFSMFTPRIGCPECRICFLHSTWCAGLLLLWYYLFWLPITPLRQFLPNSITVVAGLPLASAWWLVKSPLYTDHLVGSLSDCLLSMTSPQTNSSSGSDATAHMSEEVKDAGRYVPIAIAWGYFVSSHNAQP